MEFLGISESVKGSAERGEWVGVATLVIWLLIAFLKSDRFPLDVSPRARVFLAVGLGQVYAIGEAVIGGMPWGAAIVRGVITSAMTVFAQEVLFGGKERKPGGATAGAGAVGVLMLVLVTFVAGCVDAVKAGALVANKMSAAGDAAAPKLEAKCVAPMVAAAAMQDVLKKAATVKVVSEDCDEIMLAYDAMRRSHVVLRNLLLSAEDGVITVGELIDATKEGAAQLTAFIKVAEGLDK